MKVEVDSQKNKESCFALRSALGSQELLPNDRTNIANTIEERGGRALGMFS